MKVAQSISCFELLVHPWRFLEPQVDTAEPLLPSPGAVSTAGSVNQRPRPLVPWSGWQRRGRWWLLCSFKCTFIEMGKSAILMPAAASLGLCRASPRDCSVRVLFGLGF